MHRHTLNHLLLTLLLAVSTLTACHSPQVTSVDITVSITTDGETRDVTLPAGSRLQAFEAARITDGNLDKSEPPLYTVLNNGDSVTLTRTEEKFGTEERTILI